jgi:glyoxylase-like metal-dependent hydrolase (beta-lactamase superfamily II)
MSLGEANGSRADASQGAAAPSREETRSGVVTAVSPLVRRLVAPNPSVFTFTGTCSYIIGEGEVAILDPGPDDEAHLSALLAAIAGERVAYIVVTHTHRDHSSLAGRLRSVTRAPIVGARAHVARPGAPEGLDSAHDQNYSPDAVLADAETLAFGGVTLTAIATPGHAANHVAFALPDEKALFSGDHVMAWSTTVVAPPDGSMSDYMASLEKLRARDEQIYWPGHGGPVTDPNRYVRALLGHRKQREAAILAHLEAGAATIPQIVAKVYVGLDPQLTGAAGLSTLAHLEDLLQRGLVAREAGLPLEAVFRRA